MVLYIFLEMGIIEDRGAFTCSSSSNYGEGYTCDKIYDGAGGGIDSSGVMWYTARGEAEDSWVNIEFNGVIRLSQLELQNVVSGWFEDIRLTFSNGETQLATLVEGNSAWTSITISPAVDTTSVLITSLTYYLPENLPSWVYGILEIRFYGKNFVHLPDK